MDIKIKACERNIALEVLDKNTSAHIDYFHDDGTVDLTLHKVKSITHDDITGLYYIVFQNGNGFGIAYMSYYQIVIC